MSDLRAVPAIAPASARTVCLIPGDGIGQEVIPAAAEVLGALGLGLRFCELPAGFEHFRRTGTAIPDETLAGVSAAGLALFGATASPSTTIAGYRSPILALRRHFDLFANLRPAFSLPVAASRPGVDLLIVRENTEGLYAGRERREGDTAIAERVITARASPGRRLTARCGGRATGMRPASRSSTKPMCSR